MSDLFAVLNSNRMPFDGLPAWEALTNEFSDKNIPHCRAVSAPLAWHADILRRLSRFYLCLDGTGADGCAGCNAWNGNSHPDLFVIGEVGKAPAIDDCRNMIQELALMPVLAPRRLGVVMSANTLLAAAANSLLKTAEEPPSHVYILFLLEGGWLLPTLKSRSRFTMLALPEFPGEGEFPSDDPSWLAWLKSQKDIADVSKYLSAWTNSALLDGDYIRAAKLERLRLISEQEKLSVTMMCDLLTLALMEETPFEHIFGNFW